MTVKYSELTREQKQRRNRQNAASRARYEKAAYKKYSLRIRVDGGDGFTPEQLEATAATSGQSVNAWIIEAIKDKL